MRIGGLASGMDIDTIVSDLMKAERMPLDKLTKNKTTIEWQRDAFREMNTSLLNFRNQTFDMKLSSNFRARTVTSSNENKVTATAKGAADLSSFTITNIERLATAATKVNAGAISTDYPNSKIDASASLYSIKDKFLNNSSFGWTAGSVESQTITAGESGQPIKLTLTDGVKVQNIAAHTSVKVDGKSFTVIEDPAAVLTTGQVRVDANGSLQFFDEVKKGSSIKVDFAADKKVSTFKDTKEISLSTAINLTDNTISVTIDGQEYTNTGNKISKADGTVIATITDGEMTFTEKQTEVKVAYQEKLFCF